jgi:hypothetical protein
MKITEVITEQTYVKRSFRSPDTSVFDTPMGGGDPDDANRENQVRSNIGIQIQLRKSFNLAGKYDVAFTNGETARVDRNTAGAVLSKIDNIRTPQEKFKAIKYIEKSYENLLNFAKLNEDLRSWFGKGKQGGAGGGGWDRYNTKGERVGKCGDRKSSEGKPKCLSKSAAAKLRNADRNNDGEKDGAAGIARAVRRKKSSDPNPERRGAAKNVKN